MNIECVSTKVVVITAPQGVLTLKEQACLMSEFTLLCTALSANEIILAVGATRWSKLDGLHLHLIHMHYVYTQHTCRIMHQQQLRVSSGCVNKLYTSPVYPERQTKPL